MRVQSHFVTRRFVNPQLHTGSYLERTNMIVVAAKRPELLLSAAQKPHHCQTYCQPLYRHRTVPLPAQFRLGVTSLQRRDTTVNATVRDQDRLQSSVMLAPLRTLQRQLSAVPADNPLGALAKILLPGPALYLPALLIPAITIIAAFGKFPLFCVTPLCLHTGRPPWPTICLACDMI